MKKFLKITVIVIAALTALFGATFTIIATEATKGAHLDKSLLPDFYAPSAVYAEDGARLDDNYNSITPDSIPENLKNAVVALEDKRFYSHKGVDYVRVVGATVNNVKKGAFSEGASTITQQLVKNTHLTQEKTVKRKLREMKIARELERNYDKNDILAMYLNVVYFGNGIYGASSAAREMFGKSTSELTVAECATLAQVLKNPSKYSPENDIETARTRRNMVLSLMQEQGYLSEAEYDTAVSTNLELAEKFETQIDCYIQAANSEAADILGLPTQTYASGGYKTVTYFDEITQTALRNVLSSEELYVQNKNGAIPERLAISVNNANCGINGYFSTIKHRMSDFKRPIGSTIKPFLYAAALEESLLTAATPIEDVITDFSGYTPKNYADEYLGWTDVRTALIKSSNVCAVKTYNALGAAKTVKYLNKLGINTGSDINATLALGNTADADFLGLVGGYSALSNGGNYKKPTFIKEIYANDGSLIYRNDEEFERVFSEENAYIVTDILKETATIGTARGLEPLNFEVASKTGTVGNYNGNTDAYNVAYTSDSTFLVWHGNSSGNAELDLDLSETGGAYTTRSMRELLGILYENGAPKPFTEPQNLLYLDIDAYAQMEKQELLLSNPITPTTYVKTELFSEDNRPTEVSSYFDDFTVENVSVSVKNGKAYLDFTKEKYLNYDVYRIANSKTKRIFRISENTDFPLIDRTFPYYTYVKYSIKPYFYDQFGKKIEGTPVETDTLYSEFDFDYYFG